MVYLKGIVAVSTAIVVVFGIMLQTVLVESSKIAYKKPIYGKTQIYKDKQRLKPLMDEPNTADIVSASVGETIPTVVEPTVAVTTSTTMSSMHTDSIEQPQIEANTEDVDSTTDNIATALDAAVASAENYTEPIMLDEIVEPVIVESATTATLATTTVVATNNNLPVPCTCGVFLDSQFKRGSNKQPEGRPVIMNELDNTYACNAIGQRQCQTKCLETMVQHLPNSANILCATLDRDCRKERAYLFIKNCRNSWVNTNLAAGREYCCKNGKSYPCPLV